MSNSTSAPGKIILFGEHAVVYGIPAIAIPLSSLRVYVDWMQTKDGKIEIIAHDINNKYKFLKPDLSDSDNPLTRIISAILTHFSCPTPSARFEIRSELPIASGLGSGAAVSTAIGRAVAQSIGYTISNDVLNNFVFEVEKIHHGTPSGIDNTVIVYERAIEYQKDKPIKPLIVHTPFVVLIADTGISALTHEAVGDVRKLYEADRQKTQKIFGSIQSIVTSSIESIKSGNYRQLGQLMTQNHHYLQQLTVSSSELDTLVNVAIENGALGAKLSGGGRGGNMIALVNQSDAENIQNKLLDAGALRVFKTTVR